jgi:hypothetical protein
MWRDGAGLENGEYVELINDFFSRLQNSLKKMSVPGMCTNRSLLAQEWHAL